MPASLAVLWLFGLMGWLGIPLGVATSMFCAITLGIGVDYGQGFGIGEPGPLAERLDHLETVRPIGNARRG